MASLPARWVSIDPGLKATGYCIWQRNQPLEWGVIVPDRRAVSDWKVLAQRMLDRVGDVIYDEVGELSILVSELPEEMGGAKGRASLNSGSVRKLSFYVGMLGGMIHGVGDFVAVEPSRWKGQVPKEITQKRVMRAYPKVPVGLRHDVYDAIGIGRWFVKKGNR